VASRGVCPISRGRVAARGRAGFEGAVCPQGGVSSSKWACLGPRGLCGCKRGVSGSEDSCDRKGACPGPNGCQEGVSGSERFMWRPGECLWFRVVHVAARGACPGPRGPCGRQGCMSMSVGSVAARGRVRFRGVRVATSGGSLGPRGPCPGLNGPCGCQEGCPYPTDSLWLPRGRVRFRGVRGRQGACAVLSGSFGFQ